MSTLAAPLLFWFSGLGFRPGHIEHRKDFAGKSGTHPFVIVDRDANDPYGSKFDSLFQEEEVPLIMSYLYSYPSKTEAFTKTEEYIPKPVSWPDAPTICCRTVESPPSPSPSPIDAPSSMALMGPILVAFVISKIFI